MSTLFDKITSLENVYASYKRAMSGETKYTNDSLWFNRDETLNLLTLQKQLENEEYEFDGYTKFYVYEPKERLIYAPTFKDKIVQLALNDVLIEYYMPKFIFHSYACIPKKGTHKASETIHKFMRKAKWMYGDGAYTIKLDIKKFFYTINRKVLKKIIHNQIKCDKTIRLLYKIIDSVDDIEELGLPLGNTLSQLFANIYLNEFDQYCKRVLKVKFYVRYADDIVVFVKDKEEAKTKLSLMLSFLHNNLKLNENQNKTNIFPLKNGVNSIGFKTFTTHKKLRHDSKVRMKRKLKKLIKLENVGRIEKEKIETIMNSWLGHAKHCNSYNFIKSLEVNKKIKYNGIKLKYETR